MSRRRVAVTINDGVISSASSFDDEGESSRHGSHEYSSSQAEGEEHWDEGYDELDPSDSASASADYKQPPRSHSARPHRSGSRRHKIPHARQSFSYRAPPPPMSVEPSDDYGPAYGPGRGYAPPPPPPQAPQSHGQFYGARGPAPPQQNYPQSHVGGYMSNMPNMPNYHASQMVPYSNYQQNPFSPMNGSNGSNYFGEHRSPYEMIPYQGQGYFGGGGPQGPGGYSHGLPPHLQQYMYANPPPPPPTEAPGRPVTPAPPEKKSDPEVEAMKAQLELFRKEQAKKDAVERQRELEEKIRRDTEEAMHRRMEEIRRAQEEAKKEIELAKIEAERAARDKIESERKADEERRKLHEEAMKRAERDAREKLEAEMKALEARKKKDAEADEERRKLHEEAMKRAERDARDRLEAEMKALEERRQKEADAAVAAEAAAKAKIEAAMKAEADARAAAEKKAAEEAEWRKKLEEEAKLKAEVDARAKLEAEKKAAEDAKEAEETKKKDEEAWKKRALEEAKVKAEEATKKKEKAPIKFKDAVGRKFSFPYHLCQTWPGMEELIKQAFLHVDVIGPHVQEGHYDLVGPNGEIILPSVWERVVEPDWNITMHMWPMDKAPLRGHVPGRPAMPFPPGDPRNDPRHPAHRAAAAAHAAHAAGMPHMAGMRPGNVRPAGGGGGGGQIPTMPPNWGARGMGPPGVDPRRAPAAVVVDAEPPPRVKRSSKSSGSMLGWMAGSKPSKSGRKKKN